MDKHIRPLTRPVIVCICIVTFLLLCLFPFEQKIKYQATYATCVVLCLLGIACPCLASGGRNGYCNPLTVVSVVYVMLFGVCPIYDIVKKVYLWFGYDLFDAGAYATLISIFGYLVFTIMYICTGRRVTRRDSVTPCLNLRTCRYTLPVVGCIYIIAFAANAYYMVAAGGNSLLYSLTLGLFGEGGTEKSDVALGAISMFSYCLPAVTLAYIEFGKSIPLKVSATYLMLALQVSRGFRFIIFQIAIMFLCYYKIKKGRMPSASLMISTAFILLATVLFMTIFRNDLRSGVGADFSVVNASAIAKSFDEMLWDNLRIYKNFYGMVAAIPSRVPFVYLQQIVWGTLVMFVPRAIWPGKPVSMKAGPDLDVIIGPNLHLTGQAYPNIGEYWYAFGLVGVFVFMALYAWWMKRINVRFEGSDDVVGMMLLSVFISLNLQLVIRGFTPSNFWFVIFSVIPLYALRPLCKLFETKKVGKQVPQFSNASTTCDERRV